MGDRAGLAAVEVASTSHLLGLFSEDEFRYTLDLGPGDLTQPSLAEMTSKVFIILTPDW